MFQMLNKAHRESGKGNRELSRAWELDRCTADGHWKVVTKTNYSCQISLCLLLLIVRVGSVILMPRGVSLTRAI